MRRDLRESVGLGSPLSTFITNASESINAAIKRKVDFKESDWPEFNEKMKHFVESQRKSLGLCLVMACTDFVPSFIITVYHLKFG